MTLPAFLLRFALIYVAMAIGAGALGALLLPLIGASVGTGLAIGALGASVMLACFFYVRRNRRWFERRDAVRAWAGMVGVTLMWQLATFAFVAAGAFRFTGGVGVGVDAGPLAVAMAITTALHAAGIAGFMWLTRRQIVPQILAEAAPPVI